MEIKNNGIIVGRTLGDIYYTTRTAQHFMKKFGGFGISTKILTMLWDMGVRNIVITYKGKEGIKQYYTKVYDFLNTEKRYENWINGEKDVQKFLSINEMEEVIPKDLNTSYTKL